MTSTRQADRPVLGRPPSTTHSELERAAFELFSRKGFDQTSVDDIAAAVGIGRRTFFRYYPSKADVVWGNFDAELERMRERLRKATSVPLLTALRAAVIEFNTVPPEQLEWHRRRMGLILGQPALLANSTLRFREWRGVVEEFTARRLGLDGQQLQPAVVGYIALGCSLAAYEQWLAHPGSDLQGLLEAAWDSVTSALPAA